MRGELELAPELHTPGLRPFPPILRPRADQLPFELRQAAQDRQHQPAMRCGGVGPSIGQRPERSALVADLVQRVE